MFFNYRACDSIFPCIHFNSYPVKNVALNFSRLFDGSLVENGTKSNDNPIIFLAKAMEIPGLELVQNPCHVPAWRTNKTWINGMESVMELGVNLDQTAIDL